MQDISVIILTYNEEIHIRRCLENVRKFARQAFVVDSFSTDNTTSIAKEFGAVVVQHKFENYARQFNWALQNLPIETEWVVRLDADEYFSDELIAEIESTLPNTPDDVNGYTAPRLLYFMNKFVHHGVLPLVLLRLFRYKHAAIEDKWMDEHIYLTSGRSVDLKNPFYDHNLNGLTFWTQKHNGYSTR